MIERKEELHLLGRLLKRNPVVGIVGARQVGKTTLARMLLEGSPGESHFFDLENPEDLSRLGDPMLALKSLSGLAVIDEVQRLPDLFAVLRVLVDRPRSRAGFLILGSASPELLRQSSESLAGRIVYRELGGFSLAEVGMDRRDRLWRRGGLPRSFLAATEDASHEWRRAFITTFLERDLRGFGINISPETLRRFWTMLAHYHGQVWNASEFGRSFGVADTTIRGYLDRLTSALVIRQLQPWHENIAKRQVRAPKVYIADSGLLHALLNLKTRADIEAHPKLGASWEGWVIDQVIRILGAERQECYFWATHAGAEIDLLVVRGGTRLAFEIKRTVMPRITPSMRSAIGDLQLTRLDVIHAGESTYPLDRKIRAVAFERLLMDLQSLK